MDLQGIRTQSRKMLSKVLGNTEKPITPTYVAEILDIPKKVASKHLARWASQGWLRKVRRGLYIPYRWSLKLLMFP